VEEETEENCAIEDDVVLKGVLVTETAAEIEYEELEEVEISNELHEVAEDVVEKYNSGSGNTELRLVLESADAVTVDDAVAVADADAVCDGVGAADGVGGAGAMKSTHARVRLAAEWDRSPPATSTVPWAMLRLLVAFASAVVLNRTSAPDASDVDSGRVTTNTPTPPAVTDAYSSVASCWASGTGGARPPVRLM